MNQQKVTISYGKYKCCLSVFSAVTNEFFPPRGHRFFLGTEEKTKNKRSRDMLNIRKLFINYKSMAANTCRADLLIHTLL